MPRRIWMICFRIKELKVEKDVLHVLLIMTQAQMKKGWDSVTATTHTLCVLSLPSPPYGDSVPSSIFWMQISPCSAFLPLHLGGVGIMQK